MKFLRLPSKWLFCLLVLANLAMSQTTQVFLDNFNRAALTTSAPTTYTTSVTAGDGGASIITSTYLQITNDASGSANANGITFVSGLTSDFSSPYNATLSSTQGVIEWTFNFRYGRTTNPSGFGSGSYGTAIILAGSSSTFNNTGNGYAIAYASSGTPDPIRLVRYTNGLAGTLTDIISSGANDISAVNNYVSVRVKYSPSGDNWSLYIRDDGASSWSDPSTGVTSQLGSTTSDNTYTSTSLANFGFYWAYATTASQTSLFDNFKVTVNQNANDGDGSATLLNAIGSGVLNNTSIFQRNVSSQSLKVAVSGVSWGTLSQMSITVPYQWTWTGNVADVAPAGDDAASLTNESVTGSGTIGDPFVVTYDGTITNTNVARVVISSLTIPNPTATTDNGNYPFVVKTKQSGALASIAASPSANVLIPIANIRDNDANGVPLDNGTVVAVEGVNLNSVSLDAIGSENYLQDGSYRVRVFYGASALLTSLGEKYIVKGPVSNSSGRTTITLSSAASIIDDGAGTLPTPTPVSIASLVASPETYDGTLVIVQHVSKTAGTWPASGNNATITVTDDGGTSKDTLFIDKETDLDGQTEPSYPFDLRAIFTQFKSASPYNSGYELIPRSYSLDIATDGSLPVEMISLVLTVNGLTSHMRWSTATEVNNYGFEIERKSSNSVWTKIGFVAGSGTSSSLHTYTYSDNVDQAGLYEYRIKQIDKNGAFKYSSAVQVEAGLAPKVLSLGSNYPNPFNPSTSIEFSVPTDGRAALKVYNMLGQQVATLFDGVATAGKMMKVTFDASRLSSGVYFSRLEVGGHALVNRMLFMK